MANKGRTFLKNKWITGYKPNQSDYSEFFDSFYNIVDDTIGGITDITWEDLKDLKDADSLSVGTIYKITNRLNYQSNASGAVPNSSFQGDDRGLVYIMALDINILSKDVIRIMYCPLSYSDTINGVNSIGVWSSSIGNGGVTNDDLTIWGAKIWTNTTGNIGTNDDDITLNGTDWSYVNKADTPNFYMNVQFKAFYDFDNDWFERQMDGNGNVVGFDFNTNTNYWQLTYNPCDITDWNMCAGRETDTAFYRNTTTAGVYNNTTYYLTFNNCEYIGTNTAEEMTNNNCNYINNNFVTDQISFNKNNVSGLDSSFTTCSYDIAVNTNGSGTHIRRFQIDITGLTSIDFQSAFFLNGAFVQFNEIYLVSSNATETLNALYNFPTYDSTGSAYKTIRIIPHGNLILTLTNESGLLDMNGSRADMTHKSGANVILNSANGDYIEYRKIPSGVLGAANITEVVLGIY